MVRAAVHFYQKFGLPGAGLIFLLEGLGLPIPVEIPLGIVGIRMAQGTSTYWQVVLLMWTTTLVGNAVGYFLGYFGGRPLALKLMAAFRIKEEVWHRIENWFLRHGLKLVVGTRWINWGFAQNMWLCGITRVRLSRFLTVTIINDFLWAMAWTWVSRAAVLYVRRLSHVFIFLHVSTLRLGLASVLIAAIGLGAWWVIRRDYRPPQSEPGSTEEKP